MGCTDSAVEHTVPLIPSLQGAPKDPINSQGNIVQAIMIDPHINFFQKKIEQVMLPIRKRNNQLKDISNNCTKTSFHSQSSGKTVKNFKPSNNKNSRQLTLENFATTDKKQHQKYVQSLNDALRGNDMSVTNIMGYMIQEMADIREGTKARDKFTNDSYAALKCFIYLYTGHYTYKKINSQLRRSDYEKISAVIAIVQKQLQQYNKQKFARKLKANKKYGQFLNLYRGIPKPDKSILKGKKQYWKGFTSTSLQNAVASRFGRYLFVISLDKVCPHAYMIVPEQLSQFKEQQIILFPYFYFECTNYEDFTSGARYECKQAIFNDNN